MRTTTMGLAAATVLSLMIGCNGQLRDDTFPTGSATLAASSDQRAMYAVNTDEGTVSRIDVATGQVAEVAVGLDPTRIARAGDRVFVTLRAERGIAVLRETGSELVLEQVLRTGAEPYGLVADERGRSVFVSLSQQDEVQQIDASTLEVVRTWPVRGEPRWLALHPSGASLFVGSARDGRVTRLEVDGTRIETVSMPQLTRFDFEDGVEVQLDVRVTGDLAITPDGSALVIPSLYLDNLTPVEEPDDSGDFQTGGYASNGVGMSRFNPAVVVVPTSGRGAVTPGSGDAVMLAGFADVRGFNAPEVVRSYPTSVTVAPNGMVFLVTMEASAAVVAVSRVPFQDRGNASPRRFDTGGSGGTADHSKTFVMTDLGPRGVAFLDDDTAFVHSFIDRTVANLAYAGVQETVRSQALNGFPDFGKTFRVEAPIQVSASVLSPEIEQGRRLFYAATDTRMAQPGGGVSCSTCHLDGRNDGVTWTFTDGVRQTPSLAGVVSLTQPVTWTKGVPSVGDEAMITSQGRMGGDGLRPEHAQALAAFVDFTRPVDVPLKGSKAPEVLRGKALFERADVGCATCHTGEAFTDNASHDLLGLRGVNTPTLVGIAASAPYFHDGSSATLRDVLDASRTNGMGSTYGLSASEMDDLEAYLRSL